MLLPFYFIFIVWYFVVFKHAFLRDNIFPYLDYPQLQENITELLRLSSRKMAKYQFFNPHQYVHQYFL